jgi:chromosome segregation ATPase
MGTKENINNLISKLTEIKKVLKECEVTITEELQTINNLRNEHQQLSAEVEELRNGKVRLTAYSQQAEENVSGKHQKLPYEIEQVQKAKKATINPTKTLSNKFHARTSLNDKITKPEKSTRIHQPISDISKAIGINDRLLFIKELFDGDTAMFSLVIKKLNNLGSIEEAKAYIHTTIKNWNNTSETAQLFLSIVQRRYL